MSALGLDDMNDPHGVLAYAPRKPRRADDETSIRPVLERLARSEGRVPGPRLVRKAAVEDMPPPQVETTGAKSVFPMTARLAVAAGILALVGAAAAGYLPSLGFDHAAPAQAAVASSLPKPVQTLSIQRPADAQPAATIVKDDARMPQPASAMPTQANVAPDTAAPVPLQTKPNDPSAAPLKAWAALPAATTGSGWSSSTAEQAQAAPVEVPPAQAATPPKPETSAPAHKAAPVHHVRHAARHRVVHSRRHRTARAQAAPQPADQAAAAADTQRAPAQAVKKLPLQAAIDRIFGGNKAGASAASSAPAQQQ